MSRPKVAGLRMTDVEPMPAPLWRVLQCAARDESLKTAMFLNPEIDPHALMGLNSTLQVLRASRQLPDLFLFDAIATPNVKEDFFKWKGDAPVKYDSLKDDFLRTCVRTLTTNDQEIVFHDIKIRCMLGVLGEAGEFRYLTQENMAEILKGNFDDIKTEIGKASAKPRCFGGLWNPVGRHFVLVWLFPETKTLILQDPRGLEKKDVYFPQLKSAANHFLTFLHALGHVASDFNLVMLDMPDKFKQTAGEDCLHWCEIMLMVVVRGALCPMLRCFPPNFGVGYPVDLNGKTHQWWDVARKHMAFANAHDEVKICDVLFYLRMHLIREAVVVAATPGQTVLNGMDLMCSEESMLKALVENLKLTRDKVEGSMLGNSWPLDGAQKAALKAIQAKGSGAASDTELSEYPCAVVAAFIIETVWDTLDKRIQHKPWEQIPSNIFIETDSDDRAQGVELETAWTFQTVASGTLFVAT